ncbi:CXXX repeat peptide modification system protein [Clostridium botulinum]|uniref:CXXX repeat peptide modification system protein n=1 Tax=Clostridium botulinum B str. Osaka05 TaxID=1407017 RepID=A0A0S6TYT8_CLOBO|nr:CXXX repeat peptide modification system protein [Clostridium botulinum]MBN3410315.1 CXXX repeat peptide modification system protein [Clostridium botulinum]MBY6873990.1 CXXX repeat peptide modification system protein [Clostridium botulinum]GAE00763.1 hypothetical protein CBO05C_0453 [Clostridium botulinum B str. Osaka05]
MDEKVLGQIKKEERDIIQDLYERINSLESLAITLSEKSLDTDEEEMFYTKLLKDFNETNRKYNDFWKYISNKYNVTLGKCYIDFSDCLIYSAE